MYEHRFPAPIPRELGRGQFKSTDPWSIIFTSGTTGLPKAAGLTHWSTMKMNTTKLMLGMKPGDVAYSGLPLYHAYASQLGKAHSYLLVRRFRRLTGVFASNFQIFFPVNFVKILKLDSKSGIRRI